MEKENSDDLAVKYWHILITLVVFVSAFVTVQITTLNNSEQTKENKKDISYQRDLNKNEVSKITLLINNLQNDARENKSKNLMTYSNLETLKTNLAPTLAKLLEGSTRSLAIMETFGNVYPTKDYLNERLDSYRKEIQFELSKKVDYNRIDKRNLKAN